MATIVREALKGAGRDPWRAIARQIRDWALARGIDLRDAVVIVAFAPLLAPARRAFASAPGWMPRIETTATLAASLGPPPPRGSGAISFDAAHDTLVAMQTLARQSWGAEWQRRDRRGFESAAARLAAAAGELLDAAASIAPGERQAWWERARELMRAVAGPGARERFLAQIAIEWAAQSMVAPTDGLFDIAPSGWVVVQAGGADRLACSLLARARVPALVIDTDASLAEPFNGVDPESAPAHAVCDGFEDEASAAAAQVLDHLARGERPVALIAQDRVLVRRIRALLERHDVALRDETGWKLSTTRAGASLMALLVAARPDASTDAWLDWLKSTPLGAGRDPAALASFEAACRRAQATQAASFGKLDPGGVAARIVDEAGAILGILAAPQRQTLAAWLDSFGDALEASGSLRQLRDDAAGRQALAALGLDPAHERERRRLLASDLEPMALAEFAHWVDDVLERETFLPPDPQGEDGTPRAIDAVITPLSRAMLRPFAAVVLAGADERQLGAVPAADSLLPRALREGLGLAGAAERCDAELLAFAQLLRLPRVTLLRRRADRGDPLGDSAFVERLRLGLALRGVAWRTWHDPRADQMIALRPVLPTAPVVAPERLPRRLSASAFEALRACPYRFFSRSILALGEAEELDAAVEKRDYGGWLHRVLYAFHAAREHGPGKAGAAAETSCLLAQGAASLAAEGLDQAGFLPFSASFAAFAPRYVEWLHERERGGKRWSCGEVDFRAAPPALAGIELVGRVDRIDTASAGGRIGLELIDYKTGSATRLKAGLRDRFEDTQLAFYAALVGAGSDAPLSAMYLALDGTHGLEEIVHADVATSADALVAGAADEFRRLREGAALPPLGEGETCEYCEARGLCRRDHWSAAPDLPGQSEEGAG